MAPLLAAIRIDSDEENRRGEVRRMLRLQAGASSAQDAISVLIHNLSRSGLMIETIAALAVGDLFEVELPEAGSTAARVVWARDTFFGCEFLTPVSKGTVSAALLRTPAGEPGTAEDRPGSRIEEDIDHRDLSRKTSRAAEIAATTSLILLLIVAILFVLALLRFPFSVEQGLPFP